MAFTCNYKTINFIRNKGLQETKIWCVFTNLVNIFNY